MNNIQQTTKRIFYLLALFFLLQLTSLFAQISGPQWICIDECYTYTYTPSDNEVVAFWVVYYGTGSDTFFSNNPNEVLICFTWHSTNLITAYSSDGEALGSISIRSGEFTEIQLEIISPIVCEGQSTKAGSQDCMKICAGTTVTFRIKDLVPEETDWNFWGDGEVISSDNRHITIQFYEAGITGWISYFGLINDACFFEGGNCVELIKKPVASFSTFPEAVNDTITVCRGQLISFTSTTDATHIEWFAGSAGSGEGNSFSVEYYESGFFEVSQKVSEICACEDQTSVIIRVLDADAPIIYCAGSVCMGDTVIYRADPSCAPYMWELTGLADILSGGGPSDDFIQVHWTGGASGTVSLTTACHDECPFPATERIFILGDETRIQGPDKVCPQRTYSFRVDNRDGTNFNWSAGFGVIQKGNGTNEITASFFNTPQQPWIAVYIEDCTRDCIQTDTFWLNLSTPLLLNGPNRLCPGEEAIYTLESNNLPVPASWEVRDEAGILIAEQASFSSNFSFSTSSGGTFFINATPDQDDYCDPSIGITLVVDQAIGSTPEIIGSSVICPGEWYNYSVEIPEDKAVSIYWEIQNGGELTEFFSEEINVQWTEDVDNLLRVKWRDLFSGCESEWVEMQITELNAIEIQGLDRSCIFSETFFSVDSSLIGAVIWELSIPEMGTIVDQESNHSVMVRWKQSGNVQLIARYCGLVAVFDIEITAGIQPVVEDYEVCRGGLVLVSPTETFWSYKWYKNGMEVCNQPACELGFGNYLLVVENEFGCSGRTRFSIRETPSIEVNIINLDPAGICTGDTVRIVSSLAFDSDYAFTWFRNSVPYAFDTDTITVSELGNYRLEIVHLPTGCNSGSRTITICEHCDPETVVWDCTFLSGGGCQGDGELTPFIEADFETIGNCRNLRFEVINSGIIDSTVLWFIIDGDSSILLTGNPVEYFFNNSGTQYVRIVGSGLDSAGDVVNFRNRLIVIEFENEVDFDFLPTCENEEMEFQAFITTGPTDSLLSLEWNFGDPVSGTNNTSSEMNPTHLYASAGFYDVLLRANFSNCYLEIGKTVEVKPAPDAGFVLDGSPCSGDLVFGNANLSEGFFQWNFLHSQDQDLIHDNQNPAVFRYENTGTYEVSLFVEDFHGCTARQIETIEINTFIGNPEIVADRPFPLCEGDWVELSVTGGNFSDFLWSNGSEDSTIIAESSGQYSVSVQDGNGCISTSSLFLVEYQATPYAAISGRIPGVSGIIRNDTLTACFGTVVELFSSLEEQNHSFNWNTGDNDRILQFDGVNNPFLDAGLHVFQITIENTITACMSVSPPFYVRIFPVPNNPVIVTQPTGVLCSGDMVEMGVFNADPSLDYIWNTGTEGTTYTTTNAGQYYISASNEWGCVAESLPIVINPSPGTEFFPKGCMEECDEALICLPIPESYEMVSWMKDGELIDLPLDPTRISIDESGSYQAGVVSSNGCYSESGVFEMTIYAGTANLSGLVFLDRDPSGVLDPHDSLVSGIVVFLWQEGNIIDSMTTDENGRYFFEDLPLGEYLITISPTNLPADWLLVQDSILLELDLCAFQYLADPLIFTDCTAEDDFFDLVACSSDSIELNGIFYQTDTIIVIEITAATCPINEHYSLFFHPQSDTTTQNVWACQGFSLEWEGTTFYEDTVLVLVHQDVNDCDSVEVVEIVFRELTEEETNVILCPGEVYEIAGQIFERDTTLTLISGGNSEDCGVLNHIIISTSEKWEINVSTHSSCPGGSDGFADLAFSGITLNELTVMEVNGEMREVGLRLDQLSAGTYTVVVADTLGCEEETVFSINSLEELEVEIKDLVLDCSEVGGNLRVEVLSGADDQLSIEWEDGRTGNQLFVAEEGEYFLKVSNQCTLLNLTARAFFEQTDIELAYFVPNAFTPNDDGINDEFKPLFPPDVDFIEFEFSIYDRWGKRVFQSKDPTFGWDGITENQLSDQAVFVWVLDIFLHKCGRFIRVFDFSDVTVLR